MEVKIKLAWTTALVLLGLGLTESAWSCQEIDPEVKNLIDQEQFESAERAALRLVASSPDSLPAHTTLAHVYVQWAVRPTTIIDTEALGFAPGETGTRELTEKNVERAFRSGVSVDAERAPKAVDTLEQMVRRWPDHLGTRICLLQLHQVRGDRESLVRDLSATATHFESGAAETVDALLQFGHHYYSEGEFESAREVTAALLSVFPDSPPLLSSMGVILIEFEELTKAMRLLERALAIAPGDSLIARNLATLGMLTGDLLQAEVGLEALHGLEPDQVRVLFELAIVTTAREPERAVAAWSRYLQRQAETADDPSWVEFARTSRAALESGAADESLLGMAQALSGAQGSLALSLLHALSKKRPHDPAPHFLMAQSYEREQLPKHAFTALQRAESLLGRSDSLLTIARESIEYEAGRVALRLNSFAESIAYLESVEAKDQDKQNLQYLLGLAHSGAGNTEKAAIYYERCLAFPNNASYSKYCAQNLERHRQSGQSPASAPE